MEDTYLKSAEFFNTEENPEIKFTGKKYEAIGDNAKLNGELTIRNITKPITVDVEFGEIVVIPYGKTKAAFTVSGKISRKEFGLTWSAITEAGQIVAGDEVKIHT